MSSKEGGLSPRERRFVSEYAVTRNAKRSAMAAGWSAKSAAATGSKLLRRPAIIEALRARGADIAYGINPSGQHRTPRRAFRKSGLTVVQQRFVESYLLSGNATQAARIALPRTRRPEFAGSKLLHRPGVAEAITFERTRSMERTRVSHERILAEYARLAFSNVGDIAQWGPDGVVLKPDDEIARDDRAAIQEIETATTRTGAHARVRMYSKHAALDALARLTGLNRKGMIIEARAQRTVGGRDAREVLRERLARLMAVAPKQAAEPEKKEEAEVAPLEEKKVTEG